MTALALLACVPIVMWIGQTLMLLRCGLPIRWRIDAGDAPRAVRTLSRILTQVSLAGVILIYPLALGVSPAAYYEQMLPNSAIIQLPLGMAASVLFLCVLYFVWIATDQLLVKVHQKRKRWIRRLVLLVPTAFFGAFVEELLFRAVVLADILRWFDLPVPCRDTSELLSGPMIGAVAIGSFLFAAAHYVRKVKRRWTFPGHLTLGLLLCVAFVTSGNLWLAVGLHAGGILMIMGARPFTVYRSPGWLTGASVFPFAGIIGVGGLLVLTLFVLRLQGVLSG